MELTIGQLIKIIVGVLVVVVVIGGVYLFFKGYVFDFFENIIPENVTKLVLCLL